MSSCAVSIEAFGNDDCGGATIVAILNATKTTRSKQKQKEDRDRRGKKGEQTVTFFMIGSRLFYSAVIKPHKKGKAAALRITFSFRFIDSLFYVKYRCPRSSHNPVYGRTVIPSGLIRQNLSFTIVSLHWSPWTLLTSSCVTGRFISWVLGGFHTLSWDWSNLDLQFLHFEWYFIPNRVGTLFSEIHRNFHFGDVNRPSFPWINHQNCWWVSMWTTDRDSHVWCMWPRSC
jgi:hypothetical protein